MGTFNNWTLTGRTHGYFRSQAIDKDTFKTVKVRENKVIAVCCYDTAITSNLLHAKLPDINFPSSVISVNKKKNDHMILNVKRTRKKIRVPDGI